MNTKPTLNDLELIVGRLQNAEHMFVPFFNYQTFTSFIYGAAKGASMCGALDPLEGFHEFLSIQLGRQCSLVWPFIILNLFAKKDEELAISEFYRLFEAFNKEIRRRGVQRIQLDAEQL